MRILSNTHGKTPSLLSLKESITYKDRTSLPVLESLKVSRTFKAWKISLTLWTVSTTNSENLTSLHYQTTLEPTTFSTRKSKVSKILTSSYLLVSTHELKLQSWTQESLRPSTRRDLKFLRLEHQVTWPMNMSIWVILLKLSMNSWRVHMNFVRKSRKLNFQCSL